MDLEAEYLA